LPDPLGIEDWEKDPDWGPPPNGARR
jgi:hypothetical protein